MNRRGFLFGGAATLIAAPAIVKCYSTLMPVKPVVKVEVVQFMLTYRFIPTSSRDPNPEGWYKIERQLVAVPKSDLPPADHWVNFKDGSSIAFNGDSALLVRGGT